MGQAYEALRAQWATLRELDRVFWLLVWDRDTQMPPGGAAERARTVGTVSRLAHERQTSPEYGRSLEAAEAEIAGAGLDPDGDEVRALWRARRDYERAVKIPTALVAETREAAGLAMPVWRAARRGNDWARFAPHLERMVRLQRRRAEAIGYDDHPYDALLEDFEPGLRTAEVRRLFADLRARTAPLLAAIAARADAVDDAPLRRPFAAGQQVALAHTLTARLGYDQQRGRIDLSAHPRMAFIGRDDARITVRVQERFFSTCFYAAAHECGHALYRQGLPPALTGTPLTDRASHGLDESQARLWENVVARGRPFVRALYPDIRAAFPEQLADVDPDAFYRAVNTVAPSPIRAEADEVTYNLHILLRFDLELALLEGTVSADDVPARWNEKMDEYLGIASPSDADGALQDPQWAAGLFGYFPTYALGNLMAVQLYDAARGQPEVAAGLDAGDPAPLLRWLRAHVHAHGRKYLSEDLLARATGSRLTAEPYLAYLTAKFGALYGV